MIGPKPSRVNEAEAATKGVGEVTASLVIDAPVEAAFAAFVSWERQGLWIPCTSVTVAEGDGGVGSSIEAVTRVGPAAVRDVMRVVQVDPPRLVRVVHHGRILRGPGVMRCTPMGGGRTQVVWHEWFHVPGSAAGRAVWPLLWPGSKAGLTTALRKFAKLVESGVLP